MTPESKRKALLLGGAAALALLVVADRLRSGADDAGANDEIGVREAYLSRASAVERQRLLVEQEDQWAALTRATEEEWRSARARMLPAPSEEVASSRLRDTVEAAMRELGLRLDASNPLPARATIEGEPVRIIGLTLDFTALNPDTVHRLVDRLENLPGVATNIARLSMTGPGALPGKTGLTVTLELQAIAIIGQES